MRALGHLLKEDIGGRAWYPAPHPVLPFRAHIAAALHFAGVGRLKLSLSRWQDAQDPRE